MVPLARPLSKRLTAAIFLTGTIAWPSILAAQPVLQEPRTICVDRTDVSKLTPKDLARQAVGLCWVPSPSNVTGYKVYLGTTSCAGLCADRPHPYTYVLTAGLAPRTLIEDADWDDKVVHYFRVTAYNVAGESPFTNEGEMPSTPQNVSGVLRSTVTVDLSWEPSKSGKFPIVGYVVYRDGLQIGLAPGTRYSDAGLAPGARYAYTVKAFHAGDPALKNREPGYSFAAIAFMISTPVAPAVPSRDAAREEPGLARSSPPAVSPVPPSTTDQISPNPGVSQYRPDSAVSAASFGSGGPEIPAWTPAEDLGAKIVRSPDDMEAFISRGSQISFDSPPVHRANSARQDDFTKNLNRMAEAVSRSPRTPSDAQRDFSDVLDQLGGTPSRGAVHAAAREDRTVSSDIGAAPAPPPVILAARPKEAEQKNSPPPPMSPVSQPGDSGPNGASSEGAREKSDMPKPASQGESRINNAVSAIPPTSQPADSGPDGASSEGIQEKSDRPKLASVSPPASGPAPTAPFAPWPHPNGSDIGRLNAAWSKPRPFTLQKAASPPPSPMTSIDRGGLPLGRLVRIGRTIAGVGGASGRKTAAWMRDVKNLLRPSYATQLRYASLRGKIKPGFSEAFAKESFASAARAHQSSQEKDGVQPPAPRRDIAASERESRTPETMPRSSAASAPPGDAKAEPVSSPSARDLAVVVGKWRSNSPEASKGPTDRDFFSSERQRAAEGRVAVARRFIVVELELRDAVAQAAFPADRPIGAPQRPPKPELAWRPPPRGSLADGVERGESSRPETLPVGPAFPEPSRVGDSIAAFARPAEKPKLVPVVISRRERRSPETMPLGLPPPRQDRHDAPNPIIMKDAGTSRPETDPIPLLIGELTAKDSRSRALAADELGMHGKAAISAVDALRNALHDESSRVRASVALALGNIGEGGDEVVRDLTLASKESNVDVHWSAVAALARFKSAAGREE